LHQGKQYCNDRVGCRFIDFDISPADAPCNETKVVIGPAPCVVWCGSHFPRVYTSAQPFVTITYVYRESGPALRRGFIMKYKTYYTGLLRYYVLSLWRALLPYGYSYKASCARPG